MFLKKVLNQPNLVGIVMIALLLGAGFVYAFAFDGFNIETVTGAEVEAWIAQADGESYGNDDEEFPCDCLNDVVRECGHCPTKTEQLGKGACDDLTIPCSDNCPPDGPCDECKEDYRCKNAGNNRCGSDDPSCTPFERKFEID